MMDVLGFMHNNQDYFEDFITRSTYHSNAIEGSTLSYAETYAVLWNDNSMVVHAQPRELYDAINHKYALSTALSSTEQSLSERLVKRIAKLINRNLTDLDDYRHTAVMIRGAEHIPPKAEFVIQQMMELVHDYNSDIIAGRPAIEREAEFHVRFERIHPFEDGNGRTGRILMNRGLIMAGLAPAVITKEKRAEYLDLIAKIDIQGLRSMIEVLSEQEGRRIAQFDDAFTPTKKPIRPPAQA